MTGPDNTEYEPPFEDQQHLDGDLVVYRAVNPIFFDWLTHEEGRERPVDKRAFTAMSQSEAERLGYAGRAMSVGLLHVLNDHFDDVETAIDEFLAMAEKLGWGVASLRASDVRAVDPPLGINEDPLSSQPWHALVFPLDRPNINKNMQSQLADCCTLVRPPDR